MRNKYKISGMTCNNCKVSVEKYLNEIKEVTEVSVDIEKSEAKVTMSSHVSTLTLQKALPVKYKLSEYEYKNVFTATRNSDFQDEMEENKLQQLKPLLLILFYIIVASNLLHYKSWNINDVMLDFMGLFFIVFSFFKILDLKGFPESFRMYDPLAKRVSIYAIIYPFIEIALGLMFLMRFELNTALIITLVILGITTFGVTNSLLNKKSIRCACLGTLLKLPMTKATFIENSIMIVMAILMLLKTYN